ncbi:MAG: DUF302 domain-containing protein [Candidatus Melainabacteria bacterium]|nr:DUF302 domain-containing protein [Candidatus Melainabacteria bacterium]
MSSLLTIVASPLSVKDTVNKLSDLLQQKGITIFAVIDHAEAGRASGFEMRDEVLVIFGDPKAGTNLMIESPAIGIELPLKILVWQESETLIGYMDPKLLAGEYPITKNIVLLEKMSSLMANLVRDLQVQ